MHFELILCTVWGSSLTSFFCLWTYTSFSGCKMCLLFENILISLIWSFYNKFYENSTCRINFSKLIKPSRIYKWVCNNLEMEWWSQREQALICIITLLHPFQQYMRKLHPLPFAIIAKKLEPFFKSLLTLLANIFLVNFFLVVVLTIFCLIPHLSVFPGALNCMTLSQFLALYYPSTCSILVKNFCWITWIFCLGESFKT